jgi:hypothetical protein
VDERLRMEEREVEDEEDEEDIEVVAEHETGGCPF